MQPCSHVCVCEPAPESVQAHDNSGKGAERTPSSPLTCPGDRSRAHIARLCPCLCRARSDRLSGRLPDLSISLAPVCPYHASVLAESRLCRCPYFSRLHDLSPGPSPCRCCRDLCEESYGPSRSIRMPLPCRQLSPRRPAAQGGGDPMPPTPSACTDGRGGAESRARPASIERDLVTRVRARQRSMLASSTAQKQQAGACSLPSVARAPSALPQPSRFAAAGCGPRASRQTSLGVFSAAFECSEKKKRGCGLDPEAKAQGPFCSQDCPTDVIRRRRVRGTRCKGKRHAHRKRSEARLQGPPALVDALLSAPCGGRMWPVPAGGWVGSLLLRTFAASVCCV